MGCNKQALTFKSGEVKFRDPRTIRKESGKKRPSVTEEDTTAIGVTSQGELHVDDDARRLQNSWCQTLEDMWYHWYRETNLSDCYTWVKCWRMLYGRHAECSARSRGDERGTTSLYGRTDTSFFLLSCVSWKAADEDSLHWGRKIMVDAPR